MSRHATSLRYRVYEMIPGLLLWSTFGIGIGLSFIRPLWVIYFIIIFDLYWLFRFFYLVLHLLTSFRRYQRDVAVDWMQRVRQRFSGRWEEIVHVVFLPSASASVDVVRATLNGLLKSTFPTDRLLIVLAFEERFKEVNAEVERAMVREFKQHFKDVLVSWHPDGVVGEVRGKGANLHHAGHVTRPAIDALGISYDKIIVSSFDIDTVVHPQYFAYLTHSYLEEERPTRRSYQPVPLFNNNIWDAPALTRIAANSTSFWLMTEQTRPEAMFTFSSHSMSYQALVDVGYWQKDIVTEDSRIFLQCFFHYDGDYQVKPLYIPVSMDAVEGATFWQSMVNIYKQQRRWAWGVEHFPYMMDQFRKHKSIPWSTRFRYTFKLTEGMYSWATAPILILILGRLPLWVIEGAERSTVLTQNAPYVLATIMNIALIGLLCSGVLSTLLLPRKQDRSRFRIVVMFFQWALFPLVMIVFGSFPASDAQTRLMIGKELGFWVTQKKGKGG